MSNAIAVANFFIKAAIDQGLASRDFPPAKVHGLVYLAHGWMLGRAGAAIVKDPFMADRDGVFVPALREAGCAGTKNVTELVSVTALDEKRGLMTEQTPQLAPGNPLASALAWIWKTYGPLASFGIAEHVREAGGPWDKVWNDPRRKDELPRPVPNPLIRDWYKGLSGMRSEQGRNSKLTRTQKLELKPKI